MKAHCGHEMCVLCGIRACDNTELRQVGKHIVCRSCQIAAIEEVVRLASRWFCDMDDRERRLCGRGRHG